MIYRSSWMTEELDVFRDQFRKFLAKDLAPHAEKWREQKMVDRSAWNALGDMGALLPSVPEAYGGLGTTFAYDAAVLEDIESMVPEVPTGVSVHSAIVAHYILNYGSEEQKKRWLPRMARGELIGAIAMTEPGTGSDLQSVRTTAKAGQFATSSTARRPSSPTARPPTSSSWSRAPAAPGAKGLSLIVVETEARRVSSAGATSTRSACTPPTRRSCFSRMSVVPPENLLGEEEGPGLRAADAATAAGAAHRSPSAPSPSMERAVKLTAEYTKERKAFGKPIIDFQNTAFKLAERKTEATIARVFVDWCIERLVAGDLDAVTASMAKWWCSEKQVETADECLQLHGGYGYMQEYPISRMFIDARIQKIYGGTNEIMKLLIARSL